jgi:hypothetical protein
LRVAEEKPLLKWQEIAAFQPEMTVSLDPSSFEGRKPKRIEWHGKKGCSNSNTRQLGQMVEMFWIKSLKWLFCNNEYKDGILFLPASEVLLMNYKSIQYNRAQTFSL